MNKKSSETWVGIFVVIGIFLLVFMTMKIERFQIGKEAGYLLNIYFESAAGLARIIRADIEAIRGVAVGDGLRNLMYKGLVKITGRAEILGRPMLYGTTRKFLEVFDLNSLKDLPKAEELKNPDRG